MKNDPFVDIILPNHNNAAYLEEAVDSVLQQTYKNWRLYIIDDFSQDESRTLINNYKKKENKINAFFLDKHEGAFHSRNLALQLSKSDYISFLDSDDYWSKNKLEEQINFMEKHNHLFTYTNYTPFVSKNNKIFFKEEIIPVESLNYEQFLNNTSISMSSMIIKRSILGTVKFPNVKRCEDYSFKCDLLKKGITAVKLNSNLTYYRISKGSLQSNKFKTVYWVWYINKNLNKLSFFKNLKSILFIIMSSIKRYGIK